MRPPDARPCAARPTAVVTGCAGFIGSTLCEALVAEGWRVRGADAFTDTYERHDKEANLETLRHEPRFDLVERNLARDPLGDLLGGGPPVVHLAGRPGVRTSFAGGVPDTVRDNVVATHRLLAAARDAGVRRVVWASSSSVYGNVSGAPAGEERPLGPPPSPYAATKRACEGLAQLARDRGLETTGLRLFTVYGPRQRPDMALRRMCEALSGGPGFPLHGDGSQARDLTHVDDVVEAVRRALAAPAVAALYNVGGGRPTSLAEIIAVLEVIAGGTMAVRAAGPAAGDVARTSADTSRARRELGWRPRVDLVRGLAAQLAWVRARRGRALAGSEREDEARGRARVGRDGGQGLHDGALEDARALAE
jgi:UDP-glucuronate 4-epimerase